MDGNFDHDVKEFELLQKLEIETTKIRHTTFTTLLSVSFVIPGFSLQIQPLSMDLFGASIPVNKVVFLLGFIFFVFAVFHYNWYHRYSHRYRRRLKEIEDKIGFVIYKNRVRPTIGKRFKLHFDWMLYIIGGLYGAITAIYVGYATFVIVMGTMTLLYFLLVLLSFRDPLEPLERIDHDKD